VLNCDTEDGMVNPEVSGWIQRVALSPSLEKRLAATPLRDRPQVYAQNGLWFDTLSALANQRCEAPGNARLIKDWKDLLTSVKLTKIMDQPLRRCP
jgi:Domain of Unknown Function (DUF928)